MKHLTRRSMLAGGCLLPLALRAQPAWPVRPIRLIVPYAAGGTTDVMARLVGDGLARRLQQPVVVENRGGAGATIGAAAVAQSAPDGYTLGMSNSGSHGVSPHIYPNPGYDALQDFTHVALIARTPHALLVNKDHPARTLQDFLRLARAEGEMRFAVAGIGASSHLLGVRLAMLAGVRVEPVAYRGAGPAASDVIAGVLPAMFDSVPSGAGHVRSGALRALAVSGEERSPVMPEVPTLREGGVDLVSTSWFGLSGPGGMPGEIVQLLSQAVQAVLQDGDVAARMRSLGADSPPTTPASYTAFVAAELEAWKPIVRAARIRV